MPLTVSGGVIIVTKYSYNKQQISSFSLVANVKTKSRTFTSAVTVTFMSHWFRFNMWDLCPEILQVRCEFCGMAAKLTTQVWCSPLNANSSFITSFGVGSHSSAETFAVPTCVTCARVSYARIKVWTRIDLKLTKKGKISVTYVSKQAFKKNTLKTSFCQLLKRGSVLPYSVCLQGLHSPANGSIWRWH